MMRVRSVGFAIASAIGLVVIVIAVASVVGLPRGLTPQPAAAGSGGEAARARLLQTTGGTCSQSASLTYFMPAVYAEADGLAEENAWLSDGLIFVGDLDVAASSIGGEVNSRSATEAWITVDDDAEGVRLNLGHSSSPKGRSVWVTMSSERISSSGCES